MNIKKRSGSHQEWQFSHVDKVALLAGNGKLPREVYEACNERGIECTVIGFKGHIDHELFAGIECKIFAMSEVGKILNFIKSKNIHHVVMAGGVKRIPFTPRAFFDLKAAKLLTMLIRGNMSDSHMLKTIVKFLEDEGLKVLSPDDIVLDIKSKKGNLTTVPISEAAMQDIDQGYKILKEVGKYGVGQALVIQQGLVLGFEGPDGTDALIKRCGEAQQLGNVSGPIMVKVMGPYQHVAVDLPCIGPKTIELLSQYNIQGVAVEANYSLIIDSTETKKIAQELGIFIYGV